MTRKERNIKYKRSKDGLIAQIYSNQKVNSKARGHRPPDYTKKELYEWMMSQLVFHSIYNEWVNAEYDKKLKPSIDRLNDYVHYCFNNIQIVTWDENNKKGWADTVSGKNRKALKPIDKLTKEGEFICTYYSITEAARDIANGKKRIETVRVDIAMILSNKHKNRKTSYGFKWRYANES